MIDPINHRSPDRRSVREARSCRPLATSVLGLLCLVWLCSMLVAADRPEIPELNSKRAFGYLVTICGIGPRFSGSEGMSKQQKLIADHFNRFKARVRFQSFDAVHPLTGNPVRMNNMIVSWKPRSSKRVLLACHYDTRPFPDRDRTNPRGRFVGANDGASGVALFMELAHHMQNVRLPEDVGVDFVFFDGEELVFGKSGKYFLGSEHFAKDYRDHPPKHRYLYGVLVDMVADRRLNLYMERQSLKFAPKVTRSIWRAASKLKVREFINRPKYTINDDHIPLNEIAGIPTCDIIDFDYPHWHTTRDVPRNCSGKSLAKVGRVLLGWLSDLPEPAKTP